MTRPDHDRAVLNAHARYSLALSALDEHRARGQKLEDELKTAMAELTALARRQS